LDCCTVACGITIGGAGRVRIKSKSKASEILGKKSKWPRRGVTTGDRRLGPVSAPMPNSPTGLIGGVALINIKMPLLSAKTGTKVLNNLLLNILQS
jgi:hypothetical protein